MWGPPPPRLSLEQGSLHIWRVSLVMPEKEHNLLENDLSAEERKQCARFVRPADRARCAASRAFLRVVLAKYVRKDPGVLRFTFGPYGKPCLDGEDPAVQFNMSHAGDLAMIAVARGMRVGIDIERMRDVPDMEAILDAFFSPDEAMGIRSREGDRRRRAFFLLWTRREAAAKALGIGLFESFARFALPAHDRTASGFKVELTDPDMPGASTRSWWMRDLLPGRDYAAAVCIEQEKAKVMSFTL